MPIKSDKQFRLMRGAAGSAKGLGGVSQKVAKEFLKKTPKKKRSMFAREK